MYKEAGIIQNTKNLAKATSKLGVSKENLVRAIKNKDKKRALKAGVHLAKGLALPTGAVAAAGTGAYLSGEKGKERRTKAKKLVTDNLIPSFRDGFAQNALSVAGAGLGTAVQMKRGKSFSDAAKTGGLYGMAAGDIAGSVVFPQGRLIQMHKKKYGTMPSAKEMGKLFAVNTIPTAALWGGVLGLKKPKKFYQDTTKDVVQGLGNKAKNIKGLPKRVKGAFDFAASPEAQKLSQKDFIKEYGNRLKGPKVESDKNLSKTIGKALLIDNIVDNVVDLPTKFVTPETVMAEKEKKMNKSAFDVINDSFEKIAWGESFTKEEKQDVKEITKDLRDAYKNYGLSKEDKKEFNKKNLKATVGGSLSSAIALTAMTALGGGDKKQAAATGLQMGANLSRDKIDLMKKEMRNRAILNKIEEYGANPIDFLDTVNGGFKYPSTKSMAKAIVLQKREEK